MGHIHHDADPYQRLQEKISRKLQANPTSPTLLAILRLLFSPEDAALAEKLPHNLTPVPLLARRLGLPEPELDRRLTEMARRGVVFDMEVSGIRYVTLPPVVIGFFEFVFMRARPELPMAELAALFEEYFSENDAALARNLWQGETQLARALVREESLPLADHSEVLDWERASFIVEAAEQIAVARCQCHHTAEHQGRACQRPREACLSFDFAAESLSRNGMSRVIDKTEAMAILCRSKEAGLIQIGDNVQRRVSFICNCCGCCCHMLRGIRNLGVSKGVVSSNWLPAIDRQRCSGCGECQRACPIEAIRLEPGEEGEKKKKAVVNEKLCLGCGVCSTRCPSDAAFMRPRARRLLAPESVFDQRLAMALERGRLAEMLCDDPERLGHRALGRLLHWMEKSPPFQRAMATESVRSVFLKLLVRGAKKKAGPLAARLS